MDRVELKWEHVTRVDSFSASFASHWVSDDLMLQDFGVQLDERIVKLHALPWPAALGDVDGFKHRWPVITCSALATADWLAASRGFEADSNFSNTKAAERRLAHRGPAVEIRLRPDSYGPGIYPEADVFATRYGPWFDESATLLAVAGTRIALAARNMVGPVRLSAIGSFDGILFDGETQTEQHGAVRGEAQAEIRLARSLGRVIHMVRPYLRVHSIPWRDGSLPRLRALDERLAWRHLHQVEVGVAKACGIHAAPKFRASNCCSPSPSISRTAAPARAAVSSACRPGH